MINHQQWSCSAGICGLVHFNIGFDECEPENYG